MHKRILTIGILFLLVFSTIIPIFFGYYVKSSDNLERPSPLSRGNTLYVGGSGTGNYTKIQDAIENASHGDTIYVYNGIYPHYVWIDKSISLIGEDKNNTIIEGGWGTVVIIDADEVLVTGFTVRDCGSFYIGGIHIHGGCTNVTIIDNILTNNLQCGISNDGNYNKIENNIIKENPHGIKLAGNHNKIAGNIIDSNNYSGIYFVWLRNSKSYYPIYSYNVVKNNVIVNNHRGIDLERCNNTLISNNLIAHNKFTGIFAEFNEEFTYKNNTKIENNSILYNKYGIYLTDSNKTTITDNIIALNTWSIIINDCNKNLVYHNNIISNEKLPYDENYFCDNCINQWDNGYPSGGNFWSDYSGSDNYSGPDQTIPGSDGIGDVPYNISGNLNSKDRYPLMEPLGILYPIADFTYSVDESPVLFDASSSYDPDGTIISYEWDFGDGKTGYGKITSNKYCDIGTYDVTLTVTDDTGLKDSITKNIEVILPNIPPSIPQINGPKSGRPGIEYEYNFLVTDPDGDDFYLWVDWGDGNNTNWIGPYSSGVQVKLSHSWNETGKYVIKAKLQDICHEGAWGFFKVTMPRNRAIQNLFQWFLQRHLNLFSILRLLLQR